MSLPPCFKCGSVFHSCGDIKDIKQKTSFVDKAVALLPSLVCPDCIFNMTIQESTSYAVRLLRKLQGESK